MPAYMMILDRQSERQTDEQRRGRCIWGGKRESLIGRDLE